MIICKGKYFKLISVIFIFLALCVTSCSENGNETAPSDNATVTPEPTPEEVSMVQEEVEVPEVIEYTRTHTLGEFQITGGKPQIERGWHTDGVDNLDSPHTASDFADSKYLIFEFGNEAQGEFQFVWIGDSNGWSWTPTDGYTAQDDMLIIELRTVDGYRDLIDGDMLKIYICYVDRNWDDIIINDVYLAN